MSKRELSKYYIGDLVRYKESKKQVWRSSGIGIVVSGGYYLIRVYWAKENDIRLAFCEYLNLVMPNPKYSEERRKIVLPEIIGK